MKNTGGGMSRARSLIGALAVAAITGGSAPVHGQAPPASAPAVARQPVIWRSATQSPRPTPPEPRLAALASACGASDGALSEVAARTAQRQADGGALLHADELAFHLRASGDPHVWPRAWSIAGAGLDDEDVGRRVKAWIAPWHTLGARRCGVARVTGADGNGVVAVVAIDALADLSPLPTTARVGQWLTLTGTMLAFWLFAWAQARVPARRADRRGDLDRVALGNREAVGGLLVEQDAAVPGDVFRDLAHEL